MTTVAPNARSLRAQLAHLESGGLVVLARLQPELEYLFRHALVQNAAYASLVKADRRMLHQAAGEALERLAPGALEARAEIDTRLAALKAEAGEAFPMTEAEVTDLQAELSRQVLALSEIERRGVEALQAALG